MEGNGDGGRSGGLSKPEVMLLDSYTQPLCPCRRAGGEAQWEGRLWSGRGRQTQGNFQGLKSISGIWCHTEMWAMRRLGGGERQRMQDPFLAWTAGWVAGVVHGGVLRVGGQ